MGTDHTCTCTAVPVRLYPAGNLPPAASGERWTRFRTTDPNAVANTVTTSPYQRFRRGRVVGLLVGPVMDLSAVKIVPLPNYEQVAGTSQEVALYAGPMWGVFGGWAEGTQRPPNLGDPALFGGGPCIPFGVYVPWHEHVPYDDPSLYVNARPPRTNSVQTPDIVCITVFVVPDHVGACP